MDKKKPCKKTRGDTTGDRHHRNKNETDTTEMYSISNLF